MTSTTNSFTSKPTFFLEPTKTCYKGDQNIKPSTTFNFTDVLMASLAMLTKK